jgi:hypothetical protein
LECTLRNPPSDGTEMLAVYWIHCILDLIGIKS